LPAARFRRNYGKRGFMGLIPAAFIVNPYPSLARRKSKQFFFEKKNQKNFCSHSIKAAAPRAPISKSFCFFFQKEALSCGELVSLNGAWY
jgi:hypothetical protein